ncbi:MAG TPA: hypothetical protein VFS83_08200 [Ktedonobacterales bacterium]|nr:hypothetical protein [Ktedonobacterales bacterium]
MQTPTIVKTQAQYPQYPQAQAAFGAVKLILGSYLGISVLTLVAAILLRGNAAIAPIAVLVRGTIVVAHALINLLFAARMSRGSRLGYRLLRLSSAAMVVAIVVIIAIPGDFPVWFKIEQGLCGLLLLGAVIVAFTKPVRSVFARKAK